MYFGWTLPYALQFLGDGAGQKVVEQLLGARFLHRDLLARDLELRNRSVMLDQPSTQLQQGQDLTRQPAQRLRLFKGEPTRLKIQDA